MSDTISISQRDRSSMFIESAVVFLIGYLAMSFFMPSVGVPGNDSYYHIKMALMMPEVGLIDRLPWLQYAWFTNEGDEFVSHHYGFHVLLIPFLKLGQWLVGDDLAGARWAISTFFALALVMYHAILRTEGVPWRGLWVLLFFLMPTHFYTRHSFIRAISPALLAMFLLVWALFRNRWLLAAVVTALFNHLYLGAVMYSPVIVGAYALACVMGRDEDRRWPWKMVAATAIGWLVGIVTHPYGGNMFEFLRLQVFGTGLTPDIAVGNEWNPYNGVWWFAGQFAGFVLATWVISLVIRLRLGPRLSANELTLVLLHFAFLVLTLKARRFIEYWPPICLLSAAVLARPGLLAVKSWIEEDMGQDVAARSDETLWDRSARLLWVVACLIVVPWLVIGALNSEKARGPFLESIREWRYWAAVVAGLGLPLLLAMVAGDRGANGQRSRVVQSIWMMPFGMAAVAFATVLGSLYIWKDVRKSNAENGELHALQEAMAALRKDSNPGDIVFTCDWDEFPYYFYYNSHNYYTVGLDPKFTHDRRPDLWERFVKISRGQTPTRSDVKYKDKNGQEYKESIHIRIEDIRDEFRAKYVLSDNEHRTLSTKVAAARDFAELIYPEGGWEKNRNAKYVVFKVLDPPASAPAEPVR